MTPPPGIITTPRADGRTVYHNGLLGPLPKDGDPSKCINIGPYQAGNISVPFHGWNQQWTDRTNCPVVIRKSPAQIVAANRMFPFGDTGCKLGSPPARVPFVNPMDCSGITKYMPTTGERRDIGLVTDPSAWFMLGGPSADMIDWAQAAGSCPLHFRDEATGKPIDLLKYPTANAMDGPGYGPWLPKGPRNAGGYTQWADNWTPQQAHFAEMSYLAHVATLDLGFLEDLQYEANFLVLSDAVISTRAKLATLSGEYRGLAWGMRTLFMAHIATKDAETRGDLPNECHPSSYWKKLLDNQLAYYSQFMADPANQVFRLFSGGTKFGPWQCDYMLEALPFGVLTGHSDWAPFYLWCLKNAIDRTSGKSGFPPGYGGAYYMVTARCGGDWNTNVMPKPADAGKHFATWGEAFEDMQLYGAAQGNPTGLTQSQYDALLANPLNGGKAMVGNESVMAVRAVIVMAQYLHLKGLVDVKSAYPDLDLCFANVDRMVRNYGSMNPRQSYVLDASQASPVIVPIPPIAQPPTEIDMSDTKLAVGETKHLTIALVPADYDRTGLTYTAAPDGLVELSPNDTGVSVHRVAIGTATITASLAGKTQTAEALDDIPLESIALSWDS